MTEPEAGTKWNVRQAGSLTAEHRDRDGLIRVPRLGQNREAAVYALRAPDTKAGPGARPSQTAERIAPGATCHRSTSPGGRAPLTAAPRGPRQARLSCSAHPDRC